MYTARIGRRAGIVKVVPHFGSRTPPSRCAGGVIVKPQRRHRRSISAIVQFACGFARIRSRRSLDLIAWSLRATTKPRSRRGGGWRSRRFAGRQAQARQVKLAVLGVPIEAGVRYHERRDGAQPRDDLSRVVEPTHMGVAGGERAIRAWEAGILLDREEQLRHGLLEAPTAEMRRAYCLERIADMGAGTEPQRGFEMLDRDVGLARPHLEHAADVPAAREVR